MNKDIETKLAQVMQLISEVGAMLAEQSKPAQVMSRIQAAQQSMRAQAPPLQIVTAAKRAAGGRKERAHFYLRIAARGDETNDRIYRVVGDAGLTEANRMEAELQRDGAWTVQRLDSREFQALTERRLRMIREGAAGYVGATSSEDLRGPETVQQ
jgi:hypothetical protein